MTRVGAPADHIVAVSISALFHVKAELDAGAVRSLVRITLHIAGTTPVTSRSASELSRTFVFQNAAVSTSPVRAEGERRGRGVGYDSAYE